MVQDARSGAENPDSKKLGHHSLAACHKQIAVVCKTGLSLLRMTVWR